MPAGERRGAPAAGALAAGAFAAGAVAGGAVAVGAIAVGGLAIGGVAIGGFAFRRGRGGHLALDTLEVRHLKVGDLEVARRVDRT